MAEIGKDEFNHLLEEQMTRFGIPKRSQALKNPRVVSELLKSASKLGRSTPSLNQIVANALALKV